MDTCIAIIMYCLRLFLLFTGKQHCLHLKLFRGTYLQRISVFMQNFKFGGVTVLSVQLFNKIKKKKTKNMKKQVSLYIFPLCYVEIHLFLVNLFFFVCFLDIDVTRNGNNLKLKVKSEFSLSMGLMVISHSNPYIHSTTRDTDQIYFLYKPRARS